MSVYVIFSSDGVSRQLVNIFSSQEKANEYMQYYQKNYPHFKFNCVEYSVIE